MSAEGRWGKRVEKADQGRDTRADVALGSMVSTRTGLVNLPLDDRCHSIENSTDEISDAD